MKKITNNQTNSLLFVKSGEDISDIQNAVFRQLGSNTETVIPVSILEYDCFTVVIDIILSDNQLSNANYLVKFVDSLDETKFTSTILVNGNDDVNRAYIIID